MVGLYIDVKTAISGVLGFFRADYLIEYFHQIQDKYKHLSAKHLTALAQMMKLSVVEVYEVASFYHHFDVIDDNETVPPDLTIRVCDSISCQMQGAENLIEQLESDYSKASVRIQRVPCVGRCDKAPVAVVGKNPVESATSEKVKTVVSSNTYEAPLPNVYTYEEFRDLGGYAFIAKLQKDFNEEKKEEIINALETSKLRGLGGAGFPVGQKWRIVSQQTAPRTIAVNIDEGEPGTFKDLYYLEKDPRRFIEGMLIAALTVGIDIIYIYLRDEYPACYELLQTELDKLRSDPCCDVPEIHLRRGAGAYICGEESAMIDPSKVNVACLVCARLMWQRWVSLVSLRSFTIWKHSIGFAILLPKGQTGSPHKVAMVVLVCAHSP